MLMGGPFTSEWGTPKRLLWVSGPHRMEYGEAWELQKSAVEMRRASCVPDLLFLIEHPPVYTMGRAGSDQDMLVPEEQLQRLGIPLYRCDRGGKVTFHGPGQLVGYPILDLGQHRRDVHWYLRMLEEVVIDTLARFGIWAHREPGLTGVWVGGDKIAAIGIKISRWITMHGFALNVDPDLRYFDRIVPCGLHGWGVTSMAQLLKDPPALEEVAVVLVETFCSRMGYAEVKWVPLEDLSKEVHEGAEQVGSLPSRTTRSESTELRR